MSSEPSILPARPTIFRRIVALVASPYHFMTEGWFEDASWVPLVIMIVALSGLRLAMVPEMQKEYSTDDFKKWYVEKQKVTEEKATEEIARMKEIAPYMSFVEAPVMVIAGAAGVGVMLFLIGRFSYKQRLPFVSLFKMVCWASLVSVFPLVAQMGLKLASVNIDLPTNIAFCLPKSLSTSYFYNILQALDLFLIWQVWLLSLGMAALYKVSRQRALSSVGTMFVIIVVLNAMAMTMSAK